MSKKIEFEYEGTKYCLEYSRDAIKVMERQGFDLNKFMSQPMTSVDLAFEGAFLKNHRTIKAAKVKEIYEALGNKNELANELLDMISETYNTLFDDNEDSNGKNIQWKTV